jgi:Metallopeptidase family M81
VLPSDERSIHRHFDATAFAVPPPFSLGDDSRTEPQLAGDLLPNPSETYQTRWAQMHWAMYGSCVLLMTVSLGGARAQRITVGIGGISHESNSFNPSKTTVADFGAARDVTPSADLFELWRKSNTEVTGYLDGAAEAGFDVFPGFVTSATPKGPLTNDALDTLTARLIVSLKSAAKLDGILLALHGAMVADGSVAVVDARLAG